jgi:hypothetical protein
VLFWREAPESVAPDPQAQVGSLVLKYVKVDEESQSGRETSTLLKSGWGFRLTVHSASAREVWSWDLGSGIVRVEEWRGRWRGS